MGEGSRNDFCGNFCKDKRRRVSSFQRSCAAGSGPVCSLNCCCSRLLCCCVLLPVSHCSAKTQTVTLYHSCRFLRSQIYYPTHGPMQLEGVELYWTRLILRRRGAVAASSDLHYYITRTFLAVAVLGTLCCFQSKWAPHDCSVLL